VKILWGEYDTYFSKGVARELQSHLKHSTLHLIAAGHWLQSDAPDQLAQLMLDDR
jgi:haloalkane dehalogenase